MGNRSKDSEKQDPFKRWLSKAWNPDTGAMSITMYDLNRASKGKGLLLPAPALSAKSKAYVD